MALKNINEAASLMGKKSAEARRKRLGADGMRKAMMELELKRWPQKKTPTKVSTQTEE